MPILADASGMDGEQRRGEKGGVHGEFALFRA